MRDIFFTLRDFFRLREIEGWRVNIRSFLLVARETYRFLQSPNVKPIDRPSKAHFDGGDEIVSAAVQRPLFSPREPLAHLGGEKWWSWLASYRSSSSLASFALRAREWSSLGTRHFSLYLTWLAEPRVFHYLSREHCSEARVSERRAKRTYHVSARMSQNREYTFSKYIREIMEPTSLCAIWLISSLTMFWIHNKLQNYVLTKLCRQICTFSHNVNS